MLRGENKASFCTDGVAVEPGRKMEAVDSDGVDTVDSRPKETGEGGIVTSAVTAESAAVDKDE